MTEAVIDLFEVIQVEEHNTELPVMPVCMQQCLVQTVVEKDPVG